MKCYRKMRTKEIVLEDEAREYALTELGLINNGKLVIIPKGKNGEYTIEQLDNLDATVDWFYSGDWYEDEIYDTENEKSVYDI